MTDETAAIRVTGCQPGSRVTIQADLADGGGHPWTSEAEFVADSSGAVDLSTQAPVKGSYREVSAMGLIWSMRPTSKDVHIYQQQPSLGAQIINFHLLIDGKEVAGAQLNQTVLRGGVQQIHLDGALHGVLFVPPSAGKHPGILVVGGSEGGMPLRRAAWLASHDYVALALCYFRCEGTPPILENIPLEYFGKALGWLAQRPEVLPDRLAVMGTSRGGELVLQLGSMFPQIKAVVAYVPANVRYPSCCQRQPLATWTWNGQPLDWAGKMNKGDVNAMWRAAIPVEHIHGPVLLIGGQDDLVWPSAEMVDAINSRLRDNHFAYQIVKLTYPHAGHRAGMPEIIPAWHNAVPNSLGNNFTAYGGTPEGNAASSLDAIPKVLEFLRTNLAVSPAAGN